MYGCFIMLLVDWHSVLFALCSFQCSQMAMTADDETEYFVCSDKILIIVSAARSLTCRDDLDSKWRLLLAEKELSRVSLLS